MSSTTSTPVDGNRRQGRDGATSRPVTFDVAGWKSGGCHPQCRRSTLLGCRHRARRPLGKLEGGGHRLHELGVNCAGAIHDGCGVEAAMVLVVLGTIEVEEEGGSGVRGRMTS